MSIRIGEWNDCRNRRYLIIHVYCNDTSLNYCLIRIHGKCSAGKVLPLLQERFEAFEIELEAHIVATSGDCATVMARFGKLSQTTQLLRYHHEHSLHVTEVFWAKRSWKVLHPVQVKAADVNMMQLLNTRQMTPLTLIEIIYPEATSMICKMKSFRKILL
jgi:hypothetical protein